MSIWWSAAAAALAIAVLAGVGDWRRSRRRNLDRVGWVDWPTMQMLAVFAGLVCVAVACRG